MPKPTPSTPTTSDRTVVDLDALLTTRYPDFVLGGITFQGRPIGWTIAVGFDRQAPAEQIDTLARALRARAGDQADQLTDEWLELHLTRPAIEAVVGMLFRGERPEAPAA